MGGGSFWLIPPAADHTKLCSVDLPQCPKAAAPAAALQPAPFRDTPPPTHNPLLAVAIINTYLKDFQTKPARGHMNNNTWHKELLLLGLLQYI